MFCTNLKQLLTKQNKTSITDDIRNKNTTLSKFLFHNNRAVTNSTFL